MKTDRAVCIYGDFKVTANRVSHVDQQLLLRREDIFASVVILNSSPSLSENGG